jgi:hypothetical protein
MTWTDRLPLVRGACLSLMLAALPLTSRAQPANAVALDVVASVDAVAHSTPPRSVAVWFDIFSAVRVADGLELLARPVFSRRTFDGDWQEQLYQLGVRYERRGANARNVGLRLDVGQMPSPIGIAMLENRADLNPVVSQHSAYYVALPRVDPEIPRTFLIAGTYPFGAQFTISGARWDARVAAIDSSPVRGRTMLGANKPPRLLNGVAGAGFTPRVGLRFGTGVAYGPYVSVDEVRDKSKGDRDALMIQFEGEWSFGYTRIVGEWVRSVFETSRADARAMGGWIEATQTLSPRVFVAGRFDSQHFDYQRPVIQDFQSQRYTRVEAILGVRLTPDLTLRGGYLARDGYVVSHWDDQLIGSVVWQRKVF